MRIDEIDKLTKEAAIDKLKAIFSNEGVVQTYFATEDLMLQTAAKMDEFRETIDFTADDGKDQYSIISNYMQKSLEWAKNQKQLRELIDEDIMREAKRKRLEARSGTLESRISKMGKKE
jgi:microsomal dipeptidase-like Zn-dependent dipeptidase